MLNQLQKYVWEIPREGAMRVPGRIFASEALIESLQKDKTITQIKNVAALPGIIEASFAMPDAHQGYGFPIGGVAAFDLAEGVVSPGGVGYDINCGVRLLASNLTRTQFAPLRARIIDALYKTIPSGLGESSALRLSDKELDRVLTRGIAWAVESGYASTHDCARTEDEGTIASADASLVSARAKARGRNQIGTLGSGNHFLEIQEVETIYHTPLARAFGITQEGQITVMIHCGSRGLGHQVASDYIQRMEKVYGYAHLPDRELACAPLTSLVGKEYLGAMSAAANFAFVNRQIISHHVRNVFSSLFSRAKLQLVYDIAHNIAKMEKHRVRGRICRVCVHRKGATRSFGPGRTEIPRVYQKTGCPIFLPGSMGTYSYVLAGTREAERISFGSTAHGAGRVLSRSYATRNLSLKEVKKQLATHDVLLRTGSEKGTLEEAPAVYKNIDEVARVSDALGIGNLVARLKPVAVVKG